MKKYCVRKFRENDEVMTEWINECTAKGYDIDRIVDQRYVGGGGFARLWVFMKKDEKQEG